MVDEKFTRKCPEYAGGSSHQKLNQLRKCYAALIFFLIHMQGQVV